MSRLTVNHLDVLDDMSSRMRRSPEAVTGATGILSNATRARRDECYTEILTRRAALDHCHPDDRPYYDARLKRAIEASSMAVAIDERALSLAQRVRGHAEQTAEHATRQLGRVRTEMTSIGGSAGIVLPAAAPSVAAAVAGNASGNGDWASAEPPDGALPGDAPEEVYDGLNVYSLEPNGKLLNNRARRQTLTESDGQLISRIDDGLARATPLSADRTFHRQVGMGFFDALCKSAKTPSEIADRLDSGATVFDRGYVSTSGPGGTPPKGMVRIELEVPKGTPVVDLSRLRPGTGHPISSFHSEREFLLPRGGYLSAIPGTAKFDPPSGEWTLRMIYHYVK
jgi:ADP-ribosyltransferase exoenzyme